ncbi:PTS transporter subunit EIIC [Curtobacterium flaccumfaciens]|nr:PTS transporter subunit EIIC [Curtobacterium flaccumfaciens]
MTGMHQALTPIHTTLIDQTGWTVLLPVLAMGGAGQIGAAIALWMRFRRNEALSRTIRGALPAGLLGVGEPLIYGVTLPLGRPFITACIGGAFGGGVVGLFDQLGHSVGAIAIGASDLSLIPLLNGSSGYGWALLGYGSGLIVAYVVGFVATLLFRGVCVGEGRPRGAVRSRGAARPGVVGRAGGRDRRASCCRRRRDFPRPAPLPVLLGPGLPLMRLGASAYLAHAPLAGPTFAAAAEAGATLAFTSLHIPEDSPAGAASRGDRDRLGCCVRGAVGRGRRLPQNRSAARGFAVGVPAVDRGGPGAY